MVHRRRRVSLPCLCISIYLSLCVKLADCVSRGRDSASADASSSSSSGRHADGYKLHPSGMQRYIRTMLTVALSTRARGLAWPVDRCTLALVVCLYPQPCSASRKKWVWTGLDNMNSSTDRQVCCVDSIACRLMLYFTERRTQQNSSSDTGTSKHATKQ